jgi:hypothetical protein
MNFVQAVVAFRKKYGLPQGLAPKRGTQEYEDINAFRGKASKKYLAAEAKESKKEAKEKSKYEKAESKRAAKASKMTPAQKLAHVNKARKAMGLPPVKSLA